MAARPALTMASRHFLHLIRVGFSKGLQETDQTNACAFHPADTRLPG